MPAFSAVWFLTRATLPCMSRKGKISHARKKMQEKEASALNCYLLLRISQLQHIIIAIDMCNSLV
jgi:hypothetical protein